MKILIIRGYNSFAFIKQVINVNNNDIEITNVPIGKPVRLKNKLQSIISCYNFDDYDQIYLVSMSSCIASLVDEKYFEKICMITPFFLYTRPVCILLKSTPRDFFGCHILMAINGKMGKFDSRIRVKLAEFDNITDNKYFSKKFSNIEMIYGVDHYLGENGALELVKKDIAKLLME